MLADIQEIDKTIEPLQQAGLAFQTQQNNREKLMAEANAKEAEIGKIEEEEIVYTSVAA